MKDPRDRETPEEVLSEDLLLEDDALDADPDILEEDELLRRWEGDDS